MTHRIMLIVVALVLGLNVNAQSMDHAKGHDAHGGGKQAAGDSAGHGTEHAGGGHAGHGGSFKKTMMEGDLHAEFQVMSLASMNMTDPAGNTHHIMVKMTRGQDDQPLKGVIGKIKMIAPSGAEQESVLKDYGGILAANFTFKETGNHGVICLVKIEDHKQVFKFWYPHE